MFHGIKNKVGVGVNKKQRIETEGNEFLQIKSQAPARMEPCAWTCGVSSDLELSSMDSVHSTIWGFL